MNQFPIVNPVVWKAILGPLKNVPSVNSIVFYYPRIHAIASPTPIIEHLLPERRMARVVGVHLGLQGDILCARFNLVPIQGHNQENEGGDVADGIEGGIVFIRTLTNTDIGSVGACYVSRNLAQAMFPPLPPPDAANSKVTAVPIVAYNIQGAAIPGLQLKCNIRSGRHELAGSWPTFRRDRDLKVDDQIVFVREGDQLTVGVRKCRAGDRVTFEEVSMAIQSWDENREFTVQYFPDDGEEYVVLKSLVDGGNAAAAGWHVGQDGQAVEFQKENEIGGVVTVNGFVQDINVKLGDNACDVVAGNRVYRDLRPWKLTPL